MIPSSRDASDERLFERSVPVWSMYGAHYVWGVGESKPGGTSNPTAIWKTNVPASEEDFGLTGPLFTRPVRLPGFRLSRVEERSWTTRRPCQRDYSIAGLPHSGGVPQWVCPTSPNPRRDPQAGRFPSALLSSARGGRPPRGGTESAPCRKARPRSAGSAYR